MGMRFLESFSFLAGTFPMWKVGCTKLFDFLEGLQMVRVDFIYYISLK